MGKKKLILSCKSCMFIAFLIPCKQFQYFIRYTYRHNITILLYFYTLCLPLTASGFFLIIIINKFHFNIC